MAADHLQFLKEKFITDFQEAKKEYAELPLHLHFQNILNILEEKTISPSTSMMMKDCLYKLTFELADCIMLAKEREPKTQNKRGHINAHSVKTIWLVRKMGKRLLRIETKLRNMRDTTAIAESSSSSSDLIKIYTRPPSIRPEIYGFEVQLQEIKDLLGETQDGNSIKAIWIVGMAGIGKTALAKKVFDEVKNQFNLTFWVQLSEKLKPKNEESRAEIIRKILEQFKGSATADASQDVLLQALHQKLQNKRYLIVLDNVWHLSDWDAELGSSWSLLSHCLPEGGGGAIIVTSREEKVASRVMGEHNVIRLHPTLDAQSCWSIFMDSLHMKEIVTEHHNSTLERMKIEIVDECYGLPLAATILGDVISYQLCREQFWLDPSVKKLMRLSLHANDDDDRPLQQAVDETLKLLPGVENIDIGQKSVTVTATCEPKVILQRLGRFWRTQLISVKQLRHRRKWNQRRK